jgi:hypothetical protein
MKTLIKENLYLLVYLTFMAGIIIVSISLG